MDHEASARLERILLYESEEPARFPIGFLKSITNDFSNDQKIGSGGFADVYKGQLQGGIVAVKKLKQQSGMVDTKFIKEAKSLMKVRHKNVVRFLGYCSDTQGEMWKHKGEHVMTEVQERFLCFEFLEQGSLDKHISDASSGLEWRTRYHIIKGICEGLHYLHGKQIVHLDLKPQNIFLGHYMVPKIGDFGLARSFREGQTSTMTELVSGTRCYMAPEYFLRGVISYKCDMYSLGIIITEILTGKKNEDLSIKNVLENWTTRFKTSHGRIWLEQVRVCAEIGLNCKNLKPKKRPTIRHVINRLDELERKYGSIETDLQAAHVYPLDLWFPLEPNSKVISCPVTLTNKTDDLIGVCIKRTSKDARSNHGYQYVLEDEYAQEEPKLSLFIGLPPHSSATIYMTTRKEQETPLLQADKGIFDVVMIATKSEKDLNRLGKAWNSYTRWGKESCCMSDDEDPLRKVKEFGTVVHVLDYLG